MLGNHGLKGIHHIANEVRNTLHTIAGMIEVIEEDQLTHNQSVCAVACRKAISNLLNSVDTAEAAALQDQPPSDGITAFSVFEIVTAAADLIALLAKTKDVELTTDLSPDIPSMVCADQARLEEVLTRVLDRAVRLTQAGSVRLNVSACSSSPTSANLLFAVCGGAVASGERSGEASLAVARRLLEDMKGSLHHSSEGEWRFELPVQVVQSSPRLENLPSLSTEPKALQILVAEDSDDSFALFQVYLQGTPHTITRVPNGFEAVEIFRKQQFDLIFMDVHMPLLDGYTAAKRIREWETTSGRPRVPIVVLSADKLRQQLQKGSAAGCSAFLVKPVTKKILLETLSSYAQ